MTILLLLPPPPSLAQGHLSQSMSLLTKSHSCLIKNDQDAGLSNRGFDRRGQALIKTLNSCIRLIEQIFIKHLLCARHPHCKRSPQRSNPVQKLNQEKERCRNLINWRAGRSGLRDVGGFPSQETLSVRHLSPLRTSIY